MLSKVPEVTLYFWIIKVLCTTVDETAADYLNETLGFGLTNTSYVMGALLVVTLIFQFGSRRYKPGIYWLAVVLISVVGTLISDNLVDHYGVALQTTTIVFGLALAATFAAWYASERTLSIHTIYTTRRETFSWLAVLFTFCLGTSAGDLMAEQLSLGYLLSVGHDRPMRPRGLDQLAPAHDLAGPSREGGEEPELRRRHASGLAAAGDRVGNGVEPQASDLGRVGRRAAQQRVQARDQLVERERLRHVVIAAGVEPGEPVGQGVPSGQEENRSLDSSSAKRLADVTPVRVRQADVDHERVGRLPLDALEQLLAGLESADLEILFPQSFDEHSP
jgi:hypothetical protein